MIGQANGFNTHFFNSDDELALHARDYPATGPVAAGSSPVVCLPGLTRNSRDFHELALALSAAAVQPRRVITLDSRGRGLSQRDGNKGNYSLAVEGADVAALCRFLDLPPAVFIGTSRGGLVLHHLAARHPALIRAIVLNDIGPVIEVQGLLHIRDYLSNSRGSIETQEDASARLREIHGRYFPALSAADWSGMADAIYRRIDGVLQPDYDPAIAEPLKAVTPDIGLPDLWQDFAAVATFPLLVIRGETSDILTAATVTAMAERHGSMSAVTAAGQGHAPLLHKPDCLAAIRTFLADVDP